MACLSKKGEDSLVLQDAATTKEKRFAGIKNFNFNYEWLICQNSARELLLYDLNTGLEKRYPSVATYSFAATGKAMVLKKVGQNTNSLQYISFPEGTAKTIWSGMEKTGIGAYQLDASGKQVVFSVVDSINAVNNAVWYFGAGMDKSVLKFSNQTAGFLVGLSMAGISFTDNGRYIKIVMQSNSEVPSIPKAEMAGLEIWGHKDLYLQSVQIGQIGATDNYNFILNLENGKLVFSESEDRKIYSLAGNFALVKKDYKEVTGDRFWETENARTPDSTWIVNLKNGSSDLLPTKADRFWFSPGGNYLVYFEPGKGCYYYSYDLNTGKVKNITANLLQNQLGVRGRLGDEGADGKPAAWFEKDAGLLVYDNNDIWKLDLTGKEPAINITNGFGKANNIILDLFKSDPNSSEIPVLGANELLLLQAYNTKNKDNGFYQKVFAVKGNPQLLYMGGYFMYAVDRFHDTNMTNGGKPPAKAKNANSWIVQRQTVSDAPNYYETNDFKKFKQLTNLCPQKDYQWLTQDLHSFKYLDGKEGQGILYKPENFDPSKKYPVLIVFYGLFATYMNKYPIPTGCTEGITPGYSPLWFLNNGYLVFTPDISVAPSKYGPKAFSVIEGAARYLRTLPYVDGNKLGCAAHSWSAKLGSYIFTHSTSIAAVSMSEGFLYADMINVALSTNSIGMSKLDEVENSMNMGELWKNKELWLDQTTVLNVDKAKAALLLLCNKESSPEYQNQTLQFFNALRRLDKNAWWLKYDKGDHNLSDPTEIKDYTVRYTQFLDHYLKNAPAPRWMTDGVPYRLKGVESRYELDPQGKCNDANGEPCPICEAWNTQYKRTPEMFAKPIIEWKLDKDIAEELDRKQNEKRKQLDKEGEARDKEVLSMLNK